MKRPPHAEWISDDGDRYGVIVHHTHDVQAELARPLWEDEFYPDDYNPHHLPQGRATWLRIRPLLPAEREIHPNTRLLVPARTPGTRGVFPAVEFINPVYPTAGTLADTPKDTSHG